MSFQMKTIDGSVLEGGGQIVRISVALSAICGIPIKISNIRAGRSKPGLAAQHLTGIKLVGDMCGGKLRGDHIGSTEIEFVPGKLKGGTYSADTRTAGSVSLLLQIALPCAFYADSTVKLELRGGTDADMAPPIDYLRFILHKNLKDFCANFTINIHKRGFYPKGGGVVSATIQPVHKLKAIQRITPCNPQDITDVFGVSYVAGVLPNKLNIDMLEGAKKIMKTNFSRAHTDINCHKEHPNEAVGNGSGIIIACSNENNIFGASGLGKRGINSFELGKSVANELVDIIKAGACVDNYAQDQLIIFMALAEGTSYLRIGEITLHTKTAIHIIELLTEVKFSVENENENIHIISCKGLGMINTSQKEDSEFMLRLNKNAV